MFARPPVGIRRGGKRVRGCGERAAGERPAFHEQVARRHPAKISQQPKHVAIAHRERLDIGDRQREPRAHQQIAGGAHVDQRVEPRDGPVGLRRAQRGAQPGQAVAADEGAEKQPVRAQRAADQAQRARQVADLIEHSGAYHQIEGGIGEGQPVLVRLNATRVRREEEAGIHPRHARARRRGKGAVEAAAIEHIGKIALHRIQSVCDPLDHGGAQEIMRRKAAGGAVAAQAARGAIEDVGAAHRSACAASQGQRQAGMARWLDPVEAIIRLALPPRCAGCGAPVGDDHRFCATCWASLRFLGPPWCAGCNRPFAYDRGDDARCATCLADPPRHAGVRAAVAYGDVARALALRLKYGGRTALAETMARQMARVMPSDADLLVPVPLHRWRIWSRGFNQAALIAGAVGRRSGVAHDPSVLRRVKRTPMLRGLSGKARARAVAGAFRVTDRARIVGRAVVLVDDVHTSGATAAACTRVLLAAGARSVTILCWARVLDETAVD